MPSVGTLVRQRLAEQRDALRAAEAAARAGDEAGVHDLRVAMRRLRSLLATFRPVLDTSVTEPVRTELRQVSRALGRTRHTEVAVEVVDRLLEEAGLDGLDEEAVAGLRARLRLDAAASIDVVEETLGSTRWAALVILVEELVSHPPLLDTAQQDARPAARKRLRHEGRRVADRVAQARAATGSDDLTVRLHEVRKAARRLRYAAEAAAPVSGKRVLGVLGAARRVQTSIGRYDEAVMTRATLRHLALDEAVGESAAFLLGHLDADEQRALATLERDAWSAVEALEEQLLRL